MTEESFQQARKVMASANYLRGLITAAEKRVAKWGNLEDANRRSLKEAQADGCKNTLQNAIKKLEELRSQFAAMVFPEPNIVVEVNRCKECGCKIATGNTLCGECA